MSLEPKDEHNLHLEEQVHPSTWSNKPRPGGYDYIAIGGGTAGLVATGGAAMLGATTAIVERKYLGGDCLVSGCVPSKALLKAAKQARAIRDASEFGLDACLDDIDFSKVMRALRQTRAKISHDDSAQSVTERGVDVLFGNAKFESPNSILIDGQSVRFKRAIICSGSRPAIPPIPGLEKANPLTSENVFNLTELPKKLVIIGAGPIGCEMCQAFASLGSQVTLLGRSDRLLPKDDPEAAEILQAKLEALGVSIFTNTTVDSVETIGSSLTVIAQKNGKRIEVHADKILVATGRTPNVEELDLENANIEYDKHGIKIDDYQRTTNSNVYAAGDVSNKQKFTHAAYAYAEYATLNALAPLRFFKTKKRHIPYATYTSPEVAHVGLSFDKLSERPESWDCYRSNLTESDRPKIEKTTDGFVKLYTKKGKKKIIAATVVDDSAGELISLISHAMTAKADIESLGLTVFPYPTRSEVLRKAADKYMFKKATPTVKKFAQLWFKLMR